MVRDNALEWRILKLCNPEYGHVVENLDSRLCEESWLKIEFKATRSKIYI